MVTLLPLLAALAAGPATPCYTLADAEAEHRAHPRTFSIPRSEQRRNLPVGQAVKLVFEPCGNPIAERMWVVITRKTAAGYVGRLDNSPTGPVGLQTGDAVEFGPQHVIAFEQTGKQLPLPFGKSAFVSAAVLEADAWPQYATRGKPLHEGHSGWTVYSPTGLEDDVATMREVSVDALIAKFQVLDSILDEPTGTTWRWDADAVEYMRVPDAPAATK